jgi:GNAT superfamily N-acetyltransferase
MLAQAARYSQNGRLARFRRAGAFILRDIYSGMAALVDAAPHGPELVDLRRLSGRELDPLLLEETIEWRDALDWDFSKSAELVRRYAETRSLGGAAILDRGEVAGYGYTVIEEHKGLIGDVYVRPAWRGEHLEAKIFRAMLEGLIASPQVRRIESQLMLVNADAARQLQKERFIRLFERILMTLEPDAPVPAARGSAMRQRCEAWSDAYHDAAAGVLAVSYADHIDSQINDQYRTVPGARRFLYNIIQFPGCGVFFRPASLISLDAESGAVTGISLASFVSDTAGHITQLCVVPAVKGQGLGFELLRRSVIGLRAHGAQRISLTVTTANAEAVTLYQRFGFREVRRFYAYVWEGPAAI